MEETASALTPVEQFKQNSTKIENAFATADRIVSTGSQQVAPHLESYEDDAATLRKRIAVARLALAAILPDIERHRRTASESSAHATAFAFTEEVLRAYDVAHGQGREPWCDDGGFGDFLADLNAVKSKFPSVSQMRQAAISEKMTVSQRIRKPANSESQTDKRTETDEDRNTALATFYRTEFADNARDKETVERTADRLSHEAKSRGIQVPSSMAKKFLPHLRAGWDGSDKDRPLALIPQSRRKTR